MTIEVVQQIGRGHFAYSPRPVADAFCDRATLTHGSPMSLSKTNSLRVNKSAPMARSTPGDFHRGLSTGKTERPVFLRFFAFQSERFSGISEESFARGGIFNSFFGAAIYLVYKVFKIKPQPWNIAIFAPIFCLAVISVINLWTLAFPYSPRAISAATFLSDLTIELSGFMRRK